MCMKNPKKFISLLVLCIMLMSFSSTAFASTKQTIPKSEFINEYSILVGQGYTADGIKYEVYETPSSIITPNIVVTLRNVTRYVRYYSAYATPAASIYWSESYGSGTLVSGTLYWDGVSCTRNYTYNTTDAPYIGDLVGTM